MSNIAIEVKNLSKVYKLYDKNIDRLKESLGFKKYHTEHHALENVSFTINRGETVGIIGTNGAGKSTLLKIITGVLTQSAGTLNINGKVAALLELGTGFNPEYTGIENIYLNGTMMGYSKEEMDIKLVDILEFADIGVFSNQPVKTYSSGMFARLAFAVAINVEPEILIVDEALSVGDSAFQVKCISKMKRMMEGGTTVLFVTHDMSTIKSFCKKCIYLERGRVKTIGPAEEIADLYLSETRDKMNKLNKEQFTKNTVELDSRSTFLQNDFVSYKNDNMFSANSNIIREGSGDARITAFELLDLNGEPVTIAEFDEKLTLRIYLTFFEDVKVGLGYHIRDDKNIELIGNSTRLETGELIDGRRGDRFIIDFVAKVPLIEGDYNITLVVSTPLDENSLSAYFVDFIENAYVFKVARRANVKIWNKVYLKNDVKIRKYQKQCSCCGSNFSEFIPLPLSLRATQRDNGYDVDSVNAEFLNEKEYLCPQCGATDRDRYYAEWIKNEFESNDLIKILDIAPSEALSKFIKRYFTQADYVTADLLNENVDLKLDVCNMEIIKDKTVDLFICSHVLEHVIDDRKAIGELRRILKPNGKGILLVPIDLNQAFTDETDEVIDESECWRRFGQGDHVRKYNRDDYISRLKLGKFKVNELGIDYLGKEKFDLLGLSRSSILYIVER